MKDLTFGVVFNRPIITTTKITTKLSIFEVDDETRNIKRA